MPTRCTHGDRLFEPSPPPPRRLAEVRPLPGTSGAAGRTLAAVTQTLRDVAQDSVTELVFTLGAPDVARGGGLRAGRYRFGRDGNIELDGLAFVPGVTLSGRIVDFLGRHERGQVRVGGRAAARGLLRIANGRLRGRLGGRPVRAGLYARGAIRALAARRQHRWALSGR